jgi:hypothetical protein
MPVFCAKHRRRYCAPAEFAEGDGLPICGTAAEKLYSYRNASAGRIRDAEYDG